jgi:rhodanese-related sulfurtransferase
MTGKDANEPRFTLDDLVAEARASLVRLTPNEARAAQANGSLIIDTRMITDRERFGTVADSIHAPRTKLEWIVDPVSGYSDERIQGFDQHLIVMCDGGFSSSIAAATLQRLGFVHATDIIGGFFAWRDEGLPTVPPSYHCID